MTLIMNVSISTTPMSRLTSTFLKTNWPFRFHTHWLTNRKENKR